MKRMKFLAGTLGVAATLAAQTVLGAGFGIYEGSARGNAMGTEITADPTSPSVLYNNAAGMTELEGTQIEGGATFIRPQQTVVTTTRAGTDKNYAKSSWWTVPNAFVTHQINDKVSAGLGMFSRYGLGVEYEDDWAGRYDCQEATIQSIDINPSIAVKVMEKLSLAAGIRAEWFDFELYKPIPSDPLAPSALTDLQLHLTGDSWGVGYNLGAYYQANEIVSFGLAYDSQIKQELEGDYTATSPRGVAGAGAGGGDITTPGIIRLGTSVKATDKLTVNGGVVYTMWSSYDELAINFDPALLGKIPVSTTEKDWESVWRYQLGAEYALNDTWALRAGYIYDNAPDPDAHVDYIVPSNDRNLFSIGAGYKKGDFFCDLAYTYLYILNRDIDARPTEGVMPGSFEEGDAHMVGVSVGYKL